MDRGRRWLLASLGVVLVGIGALGAVTPGLPTTVFLLGASWCFIRSFPALEKRLLRNRFFAPYMRYVDGDAPMPTRARVITIAIIWAMVSLSAAMLHTRGALGPGLSVALVLGAVAGSIAVWRFRREAADEAVKPL
jgi:uncharacterized membrane protein YbaN (DUF454 family)